MRVKRELCQGGERGCVKATATLPMQMYNVLQVAPSYLDRPPRCGTEGEHLPPHASLTVPRTKEITSKEEFHSIANPPMWTTGV